MHLAANCPQPPPRSYTQQRPTPTCYNFRKLGHILRCCLHPCTSCQGNSHRSCDCLHYQPTCPPLPMSLESFLANEGVTEKHFSALKHALSSGVTPTLLLIKNFVLSTLLFPIEFLILYLPMPL
ncbi:hypothetical protein DSO57_1021549 [Entomophthora muscae]|uniref:Uncharacterized protein n=1 Tax=Entomophthora muscae TaxID=34485 RepID=A0ACC2T3L3_9FUNG|nr:hypothetical protein DSO57_1021549 [Entomophthora muscae]